jgi:hypothetical protein
MKTVTTLGKTLTIAATLLTVSLVTPSAARAHTGHAHKVMGTVSARHDNNVELKTPDGKTVTVVLNDKTTFARGKRKVDNTVVTVGERVVVEVASEKDMTAKTVTLAASTPATARK